MISDGWNSLGAALAATGILDRMAAEKRKAAWQTRRPTRLERWHERVFEEEARGGHASSKRRALRKVRIKPKRSF